MKLVKISGKQSPFIVKRATDSENSNQSFTLLPTRSKVQGASYKLQVATYKLQATTYTYYLEVANYMLQVTRGRARTRVYYYLPTCIVPSILHRIVRCNQVPLFSYDDWHALVEGERAGADDGY